MSFNKWLSGVRSAGMSLILAALALGMGAAPASSQQWSSDKQKEHSELVDRILAADAELGSDSWRVLKLTQSPRKHETVKLPGAGRTLQAFVVYPETEGKVPVVVMLPEDQGLTDWARMMADEISALGYVVIVPDLLSGFGPKGGGHDSFPDKKSVLMAVDELKRETILADMNAWSDYGQKLPQSNGKLAALGFGWGAGQTFWFATQRKDLSATFIFYDWAPPGTPLEGITAPVYGFYAEKDPRVIKSLEATKAKMAALGKKFETVIYPGSEHMFVRVGEMPADKNPENFKARGLSLARLMDLLKGM